MWCVEVNIPGEMNDAEGFEGEDVALVLCRDGDEIILFSEPTDMLVFASKEEADEAIQKHVPGEFKQFAVTTYDKYLTDADEEDEFSYDEDVFGE